LIPITSATQRTGDPTKGKEYLLYGGYVDSGVPADVYANTLGLFSTAKNELERVGPNAKIDFAYTQYENPKGVDIVAPNCFQCHGGYVDGKFILGLGNTFADFTRDQSAFSGILDQAVEIRYGRNSLQWEAYAPFARAIKAIGSHLITQTIGSNSADKLAVVLASHRDKESLIWKDQLNYPIPPEVYPIDVPAWWILKKKNAMFHSGMGRGDFSRVMMASSVLTLQDTTKAKEVDAKFADVRVFINSIVPPKYTKVIDQTLASRGKEIFSATCQSCHGSYGIDVSYPNLLVKLDRIKTDESVAKSYITNINFIEWYNSSWFAKTKNGATMQPSDGYVAPPLDGVWATAPYLHNGSIPTLEALIDSKKRPLIWQKTSSFDNYDYEKMGLKYTVATTKADQYTYDTRLPGYGNKGHYFGDNLSVSDKKALLEYLKTL
jgi:mono/diheme cytochrome c family protein